MKEQSVPQEHIISRSTNEEKVQTLWDRWTKYFDIEPHGEGQGSRSRMGGTDKGTWKTASVSSDVLGAPGMYGTGQQPHVRRGS